MIEENNALDFNVIIPKPFILAEQDKNNLSKLKDEAMDKYKTWESRMDDFFAKYLVICDSWRIKPSRALKGNPKTLFKSKSGETHRAVETIATVWQRMLTSLDPYFETVAMGLKEDGTEYNEDDLFLTSNVLLEQQQELQFKRKFLRTLRSLAMIGVAIAETPFISKRNIEYTDWKFRSMIRSGFDTTVCDIQDSSFVFFIDFLSKWELRDMAKQNEEFWNKSLVESHIIEFEKGTPSGKTGAYQRLLNSRNRAGYADTNAEIYEVINYHGRLDSENSVIQAFAESIKLDYDPNLVDWSMAILDGNDVGKFHLTQYGDWRTRASVLTYKEFEDEPFPYGVGELGRKLQRMMDIAESLTDDKAVFDILNMWKVGMNSSKDIKQFVAEPLKTIELEDVSQMMPLVGDPRVLAQMVSLIGMRREDFRNIVSAKTNLQGQITGASATESGLSQTEALRDLGVHAENNGDVLRQYLKVSHVNNVNYLDIPIWTGWTGKRPPSFVDKTRLPINVGFKLKVVTDKDFRPEDTRNIIEALRIFASIQNYFSPEVSINAVKQLAKELFRKFGRNPALLNEPVTQVEKMDFQLNKLMSSGRLQDQIESEQAIGSNGAGTENLEKTPIGDVPTSPLGADMRTPEMSVI